ncbi:MAG: acyloxyacyl hydrolase [Bacteroidota bacterium]|nr:acyloxyacyl hydrolase [Bacteroidota bacterium]
MKSQNSLYNRLAIETKIDYGFVFWHTSKIRHLSRSHFPAYQGNILYYTAGNDEWTYLYKCPTIGLSYYYTDLGNNKILGKAGGIMPLIYFPLLTGKHTKFNFRTGLGLGYVSNPFNRLTNNKDDAIGSYWNIEASIGYDLRWEIGKHLTLLTSLDFTHFSNGGFKMPNYGLNIPSIGGGIAYKLNRNEIIKGHDKLFPDFDRKINYLVIGTFSYTETGRPNGDKFYGYSLSINANKRFCYKHDFGVSLDLFYNTSNLFRLSQDSIKVDHNWEIVRPGIGLTHNFIFSRISFLTEMGYYLYTKDVSDGSFYHRLGFRYLIGKHFISNLTLKTHFAKAEGVEFGMGYKF